ncbi:MAG: NAD-dependent protein deacetylase of SIR2 family [Candidatus Competibacter sp.]|nr:NAD-dependent protein deacetylase of SIR2 family [Candidatus Competibacter sp.]MDG4582921.1 NAD-dependent protein deacetylase of SIR2 family [Candidatus Competibacter sp.]
MFDHHDIQRCRDLLRQANAVLIGAGAGLAVEAGIDYMDTKSFARDFPGMVKLGFRRRAELMGYSDWSPELKWGYLAANVNQVRFQASPHPVYARLLDLVREKEYFVVTSNVDGLFTKNGFAEDRLFTPQGDYALMQCQTPCSNAVWPSWPAIERILPKIDPATQVVTDSSVLPYCPNCGEDVIMNVRGGRWFIEDPYREQAERLDRWLDNSHDRDLLVLEIGAGFNTPSVIRWPMERIVHAHPRAHLIRVNLQYPQVPREIAGKSVMLQGSAMGAVTAIWKEMGLEKFSALA